MKDVAKPAYVSVAPASVRRFVPCVIRKYSAKVLFFSLFFHSFLWFNQLCVLCFKFYLELNECLGKAVPCFGLSTWVLLAWIFWGVSAPRRWASRSFLPFPPHSVLAQPKAERIGYRTYFCSINTCLFTFCFLAVPALLLSGCQRVSGLTNKPPAIAVLTPCALMFPIVRFSSAFPPKYSTNYY